MRPAIACLHYQAMSGALFSPDGTDNLPVVLLCPMTMVVIYLAMGCVSIPYRRLPHQPKLFLRLIDDFSSVANFYAHPPTLEDIKEAAKSLDFPDDRRKQVAAVLRDTNATLGSGEATRRNLQRLEAGAVA